MLLGVPVELDHRFAEDASYDALRVAWGFVLFHGLGVARTTLHLRLLGIELAVGVLVVFDGE